MTRRTKPWSRRVPSPSLPNQRGAGIAATVLAVGGFSFGFLIVKSIPLPAAAIAFWRLSIGATFLTLVALLLRAPWPRARAPVVGAGLAFGAHQLLFIAATQKTSIAIVTLMGATQPLLVSLVSRVAVREQVTRTLLLCSIVALVGISTVVYSNLDDASRSWQGDALAVANVLVWTTYFLFAKRARLGGAPTLTFTLSFQWIALCVVSPVFFLADHRLPTAEAAGMLALLALGPGNGHLLINWAHRHIRASMSSLVLALVPVLASLWAHLFLDEPYTKNHGIGMALVVIAVEIGRRSEIARDRNPDS